MTDKTYYENVIDEIVELIKTNILIYYKNSNDGYMFLKEYCKDKEENIKYKKMDYNELLYYTEEALAELINCEYLYDLRTLD